MNKRHRRLIDADELLRIIKEKDYILVSQLNTTDRGMFTIGIQQVIDEIIAKAEDSSNKSIVKPSKVIKMIKKNMKFQCRRCGCKFIVPPQSFIVTKLTDSFCASTKCPECDKEVRKYLSEYNVDFGDWY